MTIVCANLPVQYHDLNVRCPMITTDIFFTNLKSALSPPVFTRGSNETSGGLLSAKTLNNIDYKGEGEVRVRVGKKIGYERGHLFSG